MIVQGQIWNLLIFMMTRQPSRLHLATQVALDDLLPIWQTTVPIEYGTYSSVEGAFVTV